MTILPPQKSNRRILIIDDNPAILEDFRKILGRSEFNPDHSMSASGLALEATLLGEAQNDLEPQSGFELVSAFQGQDGVAAVQEAVRIKQPFAVAFVDMRMPPGWDGVETIVRIWQADPDVQVVICTAYSDYSWGEIVARLGTTDRLVILKKPFDIIEARQLGHALTEKWQLLQQTRDHVTDLEERVKLRTHELVCAQAQLEHLLHCSSAVIYSINIAPPGGVSFVSDNITTLSGHEPMEFKADPYFWIDHVHPEDAAAMRANMVRLLETGHETIEYRLRKRDGQYRWLRDEARVHRSEAGAPAQVVGSLVDVTGRKQAESGLRKLSRAVEQSPVSILITDLQGSIEYVNPKFCAITGYSFEEVRGKNPRVLKSGEMPAEGYRQMWASISAGREWRGEFHNRKKNGELFWESASISPIHDDQGNITHFVAIKEDIMDRKRAAEELLQTAEALRQSARFLQSTLDALSAHIAILDEQGLIVAVNAAWSDFARKNKFLGSDYGLGANYLSLCESATGDCADEAPAVARGIRSVMAGQCGEFLLEYPCHSPQEQRWFEVRATRFAGAGSVRVVVAHENVTARRRAEASVRVSEAELRAMFDLASIGIAQADPHTGQWLRVNEKFCAITGYSAAELLGKRVSEMTHPDDRQPDWEAFQRVVRGEARDYQMDKRYLCKDGTVVWVNVNMTIIRDASGQPMRTMATIEDITERKRADEVLKEQLALRERLAGIAANAPGIIYSFCLRPDGSICIPYASPTIEAFCGVRAEDLVEDATPLLNVIHPDDQGRVRESIAESARTMSLWRAEFRVQHPKSGLLWAEGQSTPERQADGSILWHGFMSDITERKQTEEALREIERSLAHAMSLAHLVSWEYDVASGLFTFSDRYYALHGTNAELEGGNLMPAEVFVRKFMHPDDAHLVADEVAKAVATADPNYVSQLECRIFRRDGASRHVLVNIAIAKDAAGRTIRLRGANQDITERKKSEQELRNLWRAVEQTPATVVITNVSGNIEYVNPKFVEITGYSIAEALGQNPRVLKSGLHDASFYKTMWDTLLQGKVWQGEIHNKKKNGDLYWESASISPVRDDSRQITHFVAVKEEITERKRADEALKEQLALRERLARIAATVPGIIYSFQLKADGSTCIPYASPTFAEFYGVRAEDVLQDASLIFNVIHHDDLARVQASIAESARTLLPWRDEFRIHHPRKGLFWIEGRSVPERLADGSILWHGFMSDITERKRAEMALRASEEKFRQLADNITAAFWICSPDFKTIHYISAGYERIWGRTPESLYANPHEWMEAILPEDRKRAIGWFAQLRGNESQVNVEYRITRPDGAIRWIHDRGFEIRDAAGNLIRLAGIASDITEEKRTARQVIELEESGERSRRALEHERELNQMKSRFVTLVSHEFRTPLGIVNTAAHLLGRYSDRMTGEERGTQVQEIRSAVERMTRMMEDFLIHGEFEAGKMEYKPLRVDVEALCRRLISEVPNHPGAPCPINCTIDPAVREAVLDEKIMCHILGNLLSNAVKYSGDGQPVMLEVKRVAGKTPTNGDAVDAKMPSQDHLELKVSDSGIGIPAADLAKLFQSFHRAANVGNRPGTGMGLAIVKQFVDAHRGTIRVESEEGKGTTVWVCLPVASPEVAGGAP